MAELDAVRTSLASYGQSHLLAFYDELSDAQQRALLAQIAAIDFDLLDELIDKLVRDKAACELPAGIQPAEITPARPADPALAAAGADARRRGERLIADGKVAAFVVAGGQGTRLGYDGPKGCLQVTPVAKKPLFQVFAEQIVAAGRRGGKPIPWYVMTSPSNDAATREFF
ncbi:MAG: UTP--glucose-1-phosphate uridylyltransferase, partial [Phycisphaerae bacterium]|nr:UTP--glucose-1-phosphate uridylyltransferase [Phycisphaerae bacterium]